MSDVKRPALEGSVAVRGDRRLSFAEYGSRRGPAIVWMHGTPGARRQIPVEARAYAERHGLRLIGLDRPGIGSSTSHLYPDILDWTRDLELVLETLAIDTVRMIGLSGGGPYALAAGAALPDRVHGVGVLGGVAPTRGADAATGGAVQLAVQLAPLISVARVPLSVALTQGIRLARPLAGPALDLYAAVQPAGDRNLLSRPEFKAMFLDDLLNGSRFQTSAPINDLILFTRHWGFELGDVAVPVLLVARRRRPHRAVPARPARRSTGSRTPGCRSSTGRAISAGSASPTEVLASLMDLGPRRTAPTRARTR